MQYLIDTNAYIWFAENDVKLSSKARTAIETTPIAHVSIATLWEIAIKGSIGKLTLKTSILDLIEQAHVNRFTILPIDIMDLTKLYHLPFYHRDPFDRLIISQAMVRDMVLISSDSAFSAYPLPILW